MHAMPLPECLGTVVVHRNDVVTCTSDNCRRDQPLESWFGRHTSFVICSTDDCPHCVQVQVAQGDGSPTSRTARRSFRRGRLLEPEFRQPGRGADTY